MSNCTVKLHATFTSTKNIIVEPSYTAPMLSSGTEEYSNNVY